MVEVGGRAAGSTAAAVFGWSGMVRRAVCLQREECSLGKEWGTELGKLVVASALPGTGFVTSVIFVGMLIPYTCTPGQTR